MAAIAPSTADAHVKWFAPYDVTANPAALTDLFSRTFLLLAASSILVFWLFCYIERTPVGRVLLQSVNQLGSSLRARSEDLIRAGTAAFFIAVFGYGKIILTPELTTDLNAINWLQALIAVGMFWRATMVFSAAGIVLLFAAGVYYYGTFHMMDYPIFLGLAGYLALSGLQRSEFLGLRPLDVARIGTAVTLLWASVEKWAYPDWSFPLLHSHQRLGMGLDPSFYMVASGIVEFGLAFGLLWTPLVRRLAALVLTAMFFSAVFEFGKIDAIGHLPIIILLIAVIADDQPSPRRSPVLAPTAFCATLIAFVVAYYGAHAALFPAVEGSFAQRSYTIGLPSPGAVSLSSGLQ